MTKKSWKPLLHKESNKLYTGYAYYPSEYIEYNIPHKEHNLEVEFSHTSRGRSAANFVMKDRDGFTYLMSMSGTERLFKYVMNKDSRIEFLDNGFIKASFKQTKQGQNYFIEIV